jgi:hypothetical protein
MFLDFRVRLTFTILVDVCLGIPLRVGNEFPGRIDTL